MVVVPGGSWFVRLFDSLFVLRPTLMFPLWTMTLAGAHVGAGEAALGWGRWIPLSVAFSALFGLVYLINQLRDRKGDRLNSKLLLVSDGVLVRMHLWIETAILMVLIPSVLVISGFSNLGWLTLVIFIVAGVLYNFTPVALQENPIGGIVAGVIGGGLLIALGGTITGGHGISLEGGPYILAFTAACLLTALPDREGDIKTGKRTFAVAYGTKRTMSVSLIGIVIAGIWGISNSDWVIAIPALISAPVLFMGWRRDSIALAVTANKTAIFVLSLAVGLVYPLYLVIIIVYYLFARWYHSRRFGIQYPNFKGE